MKKRELQPREKTISVELSRFILKCETENRSERTIEQYQKSVKRFVKHIGDKAVNLVDEDDVLRFTREIKIGLSPGSVNYYLRGLRAFLKYCNAGVEIPMIKQPKKQIIPFTEEQIKQILKQPDRQTFVGLRDYVLLQLLFDTGMRIAEACGICKNNIMKNCIMVIGKGGKERAVPLGNYCRELLDEYLVHVSDLPDHHPIFVTVNNASMNRHTVNDRIKQYARQANIKGVRASCHTFRHTFARMYLLNGGDMYSLQAILGHETLDMVKEYVKLFTYDIVSMHSRSSPSDILFQRRRLHHSD